MRLRLLLICCIGLFSACNESDQTTAPISCLADNECPQSYICGSDDTCSPLLRDGGLAGGSDGSEPPDGGSPLTDSDGDGFHDLADNCPEVANADQMDTDGDGRGDLCDMEPNQANYQLRGELIISAGHGVDPENSLRSRTQGTTKTANDGTFSLTGGLLQ